MSGGEAVWNSESWIFVAVDLFEVETVGHEY